MKDLNEQLVTNYAASVDGEHAASSEAADLEQIAAEILAAEYTVAQVKKCVAFIESFGYSTTMFAALAAAMRGDWAGGEQEECPMADAVDAFAREFAKLEAVSL